MVRKKGADPASEQGTAPDPAIDFSQYVRKRNELRSQRLNLLIQPSLYEQMKKRCETENISVNEFVIRAIAGYLASGGTEE